jgi:hypothetical protein
VQQQIYLYPTIYRGDFVDPTKVGEFHIHDGENADVCIYIMLNYATTKLDSMEDCKKSRHTIALQFESRTYNLGEFVTCI